MEGTSLDKIHKHFFPENFQFEHPLSQYFSSILPFQNFQIWKNIRHVLGLFSKCCFLLIFLLVLHFFHIFTCTYMFTVFRTVFPNFWKNFGQLLDRNFLYKNFLSKTVHPLSHKAFKISSTPSIFSSFSSPLHFMHIKNRSFQLSPFDYSFVA